jgi:hypothetical protein
LSAKVHKNLETAKHTPLVFCLETGKNIGKIYPYQRILAKYQGKTGRNTTLQNITKM